MVHLIRLSTSLWLACAAGTAFAAPTAGTGDCEVLASGQLRSNDYIASYQGGCKAGKADGQGKAEWRLRYATNAAPIVWQGRFVQGVFLSEREVRGARRVEGSRVLLDLGPLSGPAKGGHLWAESQVDGRLPAQACKPISLQVSTTGPLADDGVARQWLDAAYQRWLAMCGPPEAPARGSRYLRLQLHEGNDWAPDRYGNLSGGVVQAVTRLDAQAAAPEWQQYTNRAAQQRANAEREQRRAAELQANERRLRDFAQATGARRFVTLEALRQNPFRFGDEVLLVDLHLVEARTPTEAVVRGTGRDGWRGGALQGAIASWDDRARIAAVRVKGRSSEEATQGALLLQLIDSRVCGEPGCDDYLRMPNGRRLQEEAL